MKPGDRVNTPQGTGEIVMKDSAMKNFWIVYLDNKTYASFAEISMYSLSSSASSIASIQQVMPKTPVQVGDRVKILTGFASGSYGIVTGFDVVPVGAISTFKVQIDNSVVSLNGLYDKDLEVIPLTLLSGNYTTTTGSLAAFGGSFGIQSGASIRTDQLDAAALAAALPKKTHAHKWKFYFGLQTKYEYCDIEGCKETRPTERWS